MRGFSDGDHKDFGKDALPVLSRACHELSWLLDRDYPRDTARDFVGDRYQLTARQRLFMARAVSGKAAASGREAKRLDKQSLAGKNVLVDGFNAIVTLEVALSGGPIVSCEDGTVRDLAGMRGAYRPCDRTGEALRMLLAYFAGIGADSVGFLIDAPVSNSGRLRGIVLREAVPFGGVRVTAGLERDVDAELSASRDVVVTSDSAILDRCAAWSNAVAEIVGGLGGVWMIDAMPPSQGLAAPPHGG